MVNFSECDNYLLKKQIIDQFINDNKYLPKQGSPEWLEERKYTIGGSEMSIIEGLNPYQSIKDLIKSKIGLTNFRGNTATNWGKLFEEVVKQFLELLFECPIYETGSVQGCIPRTSYSPD